MALRKRSTSLQTTRRSERRLKPKQRNHTRPRRQRSQRRQTSKAKYHFQHHRHRHLQKANHQSSLTSRAKSTRPSTWVNMTLPRERWCRLDCQDRGLEYQMDTNSTQYLAGRDIERNHHLRNQLHPSRSHPLRHHHLLLLHKLPLPRSSVNQPSDTQKRPNGSTTLHRSILVRAVRMITVQSKPSERTNQHANGSAYMNASIRASPVFLPRAQSASRNSFQSKTFTRSRSDQAIYLLRLPLLSQQLR